MSSFEGDFFIYNQTSKLFLTHIPIETRCLGQIGRSLNAGMSPKIKRPKRGDYKCGGKRRK